MLRRQTMKKINKDTGNWQVLKAENIIMREVKTIMDKQKNWWLGINRGLMTVLALTLLLLMAATAAQAGCPAANDTADTDNDGLSDQLECTTGITLLSGETVPPCPGTGPHGCVHPDIPDLFIVIVRASPSLLPTTDLLEFFDIVTGHEIHEGDVGTLLEIPGTVPVQRALKISENTTAGAGGGYLGELPWGVPPNITIGHHLYPGYSQLCLQ